MDHIKALREAARRLPMDPGVYFMRDSSGEIIYVGKAKHLRTRVSSYFRSIEKHTEKTRRLVYARGSWKPLSPPASSRPWCWNAA